MDLNIKFYPGHADLHKMWHSLASFLSEINLNLQMSYTLNRICENSALKLTI